MSAPEHAEIWLTPEQIDAGYRPLKKGDVISRGDLFQERAGGGKMIEGAFKLRFLKVLPDTFVNDVELIGTAYQPSFPVVLRPLPTPDMAALTADSQGRVFCFAKKDIIRGEMIDIRVLERGALASDKLDFAAYNEPLLRSRDAK